LGEELALQPLAPLLVALRAGRFGLEVLLRGQQMRKLVAPARAQLVDSEKAAAPLGQAVVGGNGIGGCYHGEPRL
jgi:hypothetical protein